MEKGVWEMKRKILLTVVLIVLMSLFSACGKKYTCSWCGDSTRNAYYDAFDTDSYFCEDCAKEYYAPFPYSGYKVK